MEKRELRNLLAGLSLAALVGAAGLTVTGCAATGSTGGADKSGSADNSEVVEETTTS